MTTRFAAEIPCGLLASCFTLALLSKAVADDVGTSIPVASQENVGENACGPCAIYNALANGAPELREVCNQLPGETSEERIRHLIKEYGTKPSESYEGKRHRYVEAHGMAGEDALMFVNDLLAEHELARVSGGCLDREEKEPAEAHLRRVHRILAKSLENGFPPMVDFRSFAARRQGIAARLKGEEYLWDGLFGHAVAILEVQPTLQEHDRGFWVRYADSLSGQAELGFVHAEQFQTFTATRGFTVSDAGKEEWQWVSNFPYLLVTAPTLGLARQREPGHTRTIITMRYGLYREAPARDREPTRPAR